MNDSASAFGYRVAVRRHALGLTQQQLAALVEGGINRATIANIERGKFNPTQRMELRLAAALDQTPMHRLWGSDEASEALPLLTPRQLSLLRCYAQLLPPQQDALLRFLETLATPVEPA